jgi:hypothetical protein
MVGDSSALSAKKLKWRREWGKDSLSRCLASRKQNAGEYMFVGPPSPLSGLPFAAARCWATQLINNCGAAATSSSALVSWTVRRRRVDETIILALVGAPYSTPPKTSIFIYPTYSTQIISFSSTLTSNQPATPRWVTRTKSNGGKCACSAFYFNAEKNHPTV